MSEQQHYEPPLTKVEFSKFTLEAFKNYSTAMGERKYAMITNDYSKEPGYKQEVIDSGALPDDETTSTSLIEKWDGGSRWTNKDDKGGVWSELSVDGIGISTHGYKPGEVLYQQTHCANIKLESDKGPLIDAPDFIVLAKGQLPPSSLFSADEKFYMEDGVAKRQRYLNVSHPKNMLYDTNANVYVEEEKGVLSLDRGRGEKFIIQPKSS